MSIRLKAHSYGCAFLTKKQHPKAAQHLLKTFGLLWRMGVD
ncbi:hypothetical protein B4133_1987 [Bacillus altitudinis]|nr:hypothetical protein B4133_1987 [Bacillus altitudinis]